MSAICGWVGEVASPRDHGGHARSGRLTAATPRITCWAKVWRWDIASSPSAHRSPGIHRGPTGSCLRRNAGPGQATESPASLLAGRLLPLSAGQILPLPCRTWMAPLRRRCGMPRRAACSCLRDPFGVRSLYYLQVRGTLYFGSELKQLLAIPDLDIALDYSALHKYLTFSFVPGGRCRFLACDDCCRATYL